jgi:hypothetical protein
MSTDSPQQCGPERGVAPAIRFEHLACVYDSDREFLEMAVPFLEAGLSAGRPVLAVTTAANLELIGDTLGTRGSEVDYAESAFFGRRPPQRIAAFHRYWQQRAGAGGGRIAILAEPVWTGRPARDVTAWARMESALNVALADTTISMICPYDSRNADPAIVAGARATHPAAIDGTRVIASADYADPEDFALACEDPPLAQPPDGATSYYFNGYLRGLRQYVASRAAAHGLPPERAALLVQAAAEAASYLKHQASGTAAVRIWEQPGTVVVDFRQEHSPAADPFLGLRPATLRPRPGDGLWLTAQLCERTEIRTVDGTTTIRLHVPSRHNQEPTIAA